MVFKSEGFLVVRRVRVCRVGVVSGEMQVSWGVG